MEIMAERTTSVWDSLKVRLDVLFGQLYDYHGAIEKPEVGSDEVWAAPPNLPKEVATPREYFKHYFQSQYQVQTKNECVTSAAVMGMNIMKDRAASDNLESVQFISNLSLEKYTSDLDSLRILGWKYRIQTGVPIFEGMMTPWQAVLALRNHAKELKEKYQRSFKLRLKPWCTVEDLIENLRQGKVMLIHGAWQIKLTTAKKEFRHLPFLGGMPHTMLLVGYIPKTDEWQILDPAKNAPSISSMTTKNLIENFWGRQFLFYPPRFSVLVISPDW